VKSTLKPCARNFVAVSVCASLWLAAPAFAQEDVDKTARDEWQAQVDRARQRVEQIRREGRFVDDEKQSPQQAAREMLTRSLDDEDLRPGDIISTERGFLRFEGVSSDNKRIFVKIDAGFNHQH
jgi:phytoene/squalene synthetase